MKTVEEMSFHPTAEKLVEILCAKTGNTDPLFFRVIVGYYFCQVASMMRAHVQTDDGAIPCNMYALAMATSGSGKGKSTNIMEDQVINQFRSNFIEFTLPTMADQNIPVLANRRAHKNSSDPDAELQTALAEYERMGPMFFSFDSGTAPAIKDIRHKLLMAKIGSLNLQVDELGTNLTGIMEVLGPYLEMFDVGKIKQKLVKNTSDNKRVEEIFGQVPACFLGFGTPSRVMNGGKTEEEFYQILDTGYARRCLFSYSKGHNRSPETDPLKIRAMRRANNSAGELLKISTHFGDLADPANANKILSVPDDVDLAQIEYQVKCESQAFLLGEHDEMRKAELSHRYFKALKLAGAYAFVDGSPEVTMGHLYNAIKLVEESGKAFEGLLTRDRPHVKLAKYIASTNRPMTHAELLEDLPFYKGAANVRQDMMQMAIAYGYHNNIIIKKTFDDGVETVRGETLAQTKLSEMMVSYSTDIATGYMPDTADFDNLHKMTQAPGIHWCSHAFRGGHRSEDDALPGFNLMVFDCDGTIQLSTAKMLLKEYKALYYTTKRHDDVTNRFRVVLPMNYVLKLDAKEHKDFWNNVFEWLPFDVDHASSQRARKWLSNPGHYEYTDGIMVDVLPFIPKTSKNEEFKLRMLDQQGMDNLERWVINNIGDGNRNNMLLRFSMILVDGGFDFSGVLDRVLQLNMKIADKLEESEIMATIMKTVGKAIALK